MQLHIHVHYEDEILISEDDPKAVTFNLKRRI